MLACHMDNQKFDRNYSGTSLLWQLFGRAGAALCLLQVSAPRKRARLLPTITGVFEHHDSRTWSIQTSDEQKRSPTAVAAEMTFANFIGTADLLGQIRYDLSKVSDHDSRSMFTGVARLELLRRALVSDFSVSVMQNSKNISQHSGINSLIKYRHRSLSTLETVQKGLRSAFSLSDKSLPCQEYPAPVVTDGGSMIRRP